MRRIVAIAALLALAFPLNCGASEVFRCGAEIIKVGDTAETVRKLCGNPADKSTAKSAKKAGKKTGAAGDSGSGLKKWRYDRGYGDYVYVLTFKGNILKKIETAERGGR